MPRTSRLCRCSAKRPGASAEQLCGVTMVAAWKHLWPSHWATWTHSTWEMVWTLITNVTMVCSIAAFVYRLRQAQTGGSTTTIVSLCRYQAASPTNHGYQVSVQVEHSSLTVP